MKPKKGSTYVKVGGVFNTEFALATAKKSRIAGQLGFCSVIRSSRIITIATPAGPTFFWAPAKISPY